MPGAILLLPSLPTNLFGSLTSEIVIVVAIIVVLLLIFRLGKFIIGLLTNSILGLIAFFALNYLFGLGIPISLPIIVVTAIFGLPAVAIIVLLRLMGVPL
ncbi:MAG: pro-sigmaK processing inhibitor BofA family protein [Candidatus Micrarchaeota archaeon]|nr:pro-sigmaK processing inhibitor BofA family protein [Candidatus Micrarchaeota archaeon]MDE1848023.1 pro-sigmaK processing inhibitor BofA family protein [Candidatus Micrarchaeota archaeon]MDE1864600.1 pro-sigmaK processing inhibitor BofA family protein [Candidatus Micrarchaeota archaeon]